MDDTLTYFWYCGFTNFVLIFRVNELHFIIDTQNAKEGYEKMLGDQLRQDRTLLVSDTIGALANVLNHKAAYPNVRK